MKVTIVIPNYNGKHFMEPCLSSLSEQTYKNFHILVVDNASSDGSIEYMEENYPDIELIKLQKNFGFSKAVNIGIQHSRTPNRPQAHFGPPPACRTPPARRPPMQATCCHGRPPRAFQPSCAPWNAKTRCPPPEWSRLLCQR